VTETKLTRDDFLGDWVLMRQIDDRRAGQAAQFSGTARFTPHGAQGAVYDETGLLQLGSATPMKAERRYLYAFTEAGIVMRFADGRDFIQFDPGSGAEALHQCDPDTYRVVHDVSHWPQWQAVWTVTGSRKDYTMNSVWYRP
jgi:hypothetical protein